MGMLLKLVHVLAKLDPGNQEWKQRQIDRVNRLINDAEDTIEADELKRSVVSDIEKQRTDVEEAFLRNELDYGRKLFLIQNCIFGVDLQPIAVQRHHAGLGEREECRQQEQHYQRTELRR